MRYKAGKNKRLNLYKRSGKLLMRIYDFDSFLRSKKIIYGVAF